MNMQVSLHRRFRRQLGPRLARAVLSGALVTALTGCGFHLRGPVSIPAGMEPIYIQSGGLVGQAIDTRLEGSQVKLTKDPSDAGLVLRILGQSRSSRVVAVDRGGKALAYALEYQVSFDAVDATGQQVVAPQTLTLERTFDDNPDVAVLGKQLESEIIYQDLAADAADQLLLRLRAALAAAGSA
jgi:LPS-assembly lipoprotein